MAVEVNQWVALFLAVCLVASSGALSTLDAAPSPSSSSFPYNYLNATNAIVNYVNQNGINFDTLAYICDTFGPRFRGTPALDNALSYIAGQMKSQGLRVTKELVQNITMWQRNDESLRMILPRVANMALLGLGTSVGGNVTADVIVVTSFDDLANKSKLVPGKIVLYNVPFVSYGQTVAYRAIGAAQAARYGAVAALVRSITPFSLYTPHTGVQHYDPAYPQIPVAAITIEDSEMMWRMQQRGQRIVVSLTMNALNPAPVSSYNVLAQLDGCVTPKEVVVLGGHSDSWDVGQGAIDDGGGFFSAWQAVATIKALVQARVLPCPRRSVRVVLWVDEEMSQRGAQTYLQQHLAELPDHIIAMESDIGNFIPYAFGFSGLPSAVSIMQQISSVLLSTLGTGTLNVGAGADADNGPMCALGVPCAALQNQGNDTLAYFWYHHTNADNIVHMNQQGMRNSVAAFATLAYVLADMPQRLPTNYTAPPSPSSS